MAKITFAHVVRFVLKPPFGVMFWPHAVFVSRGLTEHMNALGVAYGPLIFLHPAYKQYEGLLLHEQQHVKQWWHCVAISFSVFLLIKYLVGGVIGWPVLLFFSMLTFNFLLRGKMFRLRCEIDACRQELMFFRYSPAVAQRLVDRLNLDDYKFGVRRDIIYADLVKGTPLEAAQK